MTEVWVKFNFGEGMKLHVNLPTIPRVGEEILLGDMHKRVTRVVYDLDKKVVNIYTN